MKDISVILLTYNSSLQATLLSLKSVIYQKDVSFDIVISDDGSKNNHFNEIEKFFKEHNFKDYTLIEHKENIGTVKNYLSASKAVKTEYFKDLGQGDMFYDEHTLKKIAEYCNKHKPALLFNDAVYYDIQNNKINVFEYNRYPQNVDIYLNENKELIKRNQLAYDDIILGSTFVYNTECAIKYFSMLIDKAKFAEDNSVRLMALNKEKIMYYPISGIMYEFGSGISTSKNLEFEKLLDLDWQNTNDIILKECKTNNDKYSNAIIEHIEFERKTNRSFFDKVKHYVVNKGFLLFRLSLENKPIKTSTNYDKEFMEKCLND